MNQRPFSPPFSHSWRVLGASVTGQSHQKMQLGCDDAHAYHLSQDALFLVVADGAGSATHGGVGAQTAVQHAIDTAVQFLKDYTAPGSEVEWKNFLALILTKVHEAIQEQVQTFAAMYSAPTVREFATTFLFAVLTPQWLAAVQVGDGAIVVHHADSSFISLTPPEKREYVNETAFITDTDFAAVAVFTVLPRNEVQGIALLSDGLQMVALKAPENIPHAPFFSPLFRFMQNDGVDATKLQTFLSSDRISERSDDDKTLLLAVQQ